MPDGWGLHSRGRCRQGRKIDHPPARLDSRTLLQADTGLARTRAEGAVTAWRPGGPVQRRRSSRSRRSPRGRRRWRSGASRGAAPGQRALVGVALLALSSLALVALLTEPGAWRPAHGAQRGGSGWARPGGTPGGLPRHLRRGHPAGRASMSAAVLLVGGRGKRRCPQFLAAVRAPGGELRAASSSAWGRPAAPSPDTARRRAGGLAGGVAGGPLQRRGDRHRGLGGGVRGDAGGDPVRAAPRGWRRWGTPWRSWERSPRAGDCSLGRPEEGCGRRRMEARAAARSWRRRRSSPSWRRTRRS